MLQGASTVSHPDRARATRCCYAAANMILSSILLMVLGCVDGPPFTEIQDISIRHIGANGLVKRDLDAAELTRAQACLISNTQEIDPDNALQELLPTTYLIEVTEKTEIRSFELYTKVNLKGNKGRYYHNSCIHAFAVVPDK